jgi:retron-type reverse transcriptase
MLESEIFNFPALLKAARKASRSHKRRPYVQRFNFYRERELVELGRELKGQTYRPRPLKPFMIEEPKKRMIHASQFRDRVVHHAVCAWLEPQFERDFISRSYACRKERGHIRGALDLYREIRSIPVNQRHHYTILKADVRSYFPHIDHEILWSLIRPYVKEPMLARTIMTILAAHQGEAKVGLPIGNLSSQLFANLYLNPLDHFAKRLNISAYFRYMDDFILIFDHRYESPERLKTSVQHFLTAQLHLTLHPQKVYSKRLLSGIEFLGYHISPRGVQVKAQNFARLKRKLAKRHQALLTENISVETFQKSLTSWRGIITHSHSSNHKISLTLWAVKTWGVTAAYRIWHCFLWTLKNPPLGIRRLRSAQKDDHTAYCQWLENHGITVPKNATFPEL